MEKTLPLKFCLVEMWQLVVIFAFPAAKNIQDLLEYEEFFINNVAMDLLKDILEHYDQLFYVAWGPGVLEALYLVE